MVLMSVLPGEDIGGIPDHFESDSVLQRCVQPLIKTGCLDDAAREVVPDVDTLSQVKAQ